jgi:3-oxosteroid 1-dehydrogenase
MSNEKNLTRREFIKDAAADVAAVAGASALAGLGSTPAAAQTRCPSTVPPAWDYEADLVILGTGMAGLSTAVTAADAGASVLILEKMSQQYEGGNSKVCMQFIWAPKDVAKGTAYIKAMDCGMTEDEEIFKVMSEGLAENLEVLKELGATLAPLPLAVAGIAFPELPGSDCYQAYAWAVNGASRGTTGDGLLWRFMRDQVQKRGIQVLYETPAKELIQEGGTKEIVGVMAERKGIRVAIKAKKAVVLACGGLEFDYAMQKQFFWGSPVMGVGTPGNTGDGIRMAQKVGADLWHMDEINGGHPGCFVVPGTDPGVVGVAPASPRGNSNILVNKLGKRYMNDKGGTRSHGLGTRNLDFDAAAMDWSSVPCWAIFDEASRKAGCMLSSHALGGGGKWTWFVWHSGIAWSADNSEEVAKGWILKAGSLAELAEKIKGDPDNRNLMDAKTLESTVAQYNQYCADKKDPEFGRVPRTLVPLSGPPFYAMKLWPNTANTMGGPRRNKLCQIVDPDKKPIARLYGTGELGSFWGWGYNSGGNIGECLFSGRIAAKQAEALKPWDAGV